MPRVCLRETVTLCAHTHVHVHAWCAFMRFCALQCLLVIMRVDTRVFARDSMLVEGAVLCIFTCVDFSERVEWHCVVNVRVIEAQHKLHVNTMIIPITWCGFRLIYLTS